ncbi:MAG: peptidoglycan-binding protein [Patescibacteria group bacterium]|nr:peptidoglycan-binding protein [Patescibacteria group bacterium]MDE1965733.1 peptidoglycan-binding protein [Patescibacteria group bacterium]
MNRIRFSFTLGIASFVLLFSGGLTAHAAALTVESILPGSSVDPGQTVTAYISAIGFTNPSYTASGGGSIDGYGYYTWTPAAADAGGHDITITATDSLGDTATATVHIYVVPNAISIENLSPGETAFTREPVTFTVSAPGFTNPTFYVHDAYAGSTVWYADIATDGTFSWTPSFGEQGQHSITVTAQDAYGHGAHTTQSIMVLPPSVAITNFAPGTSVAVGTPVTFTASTTGFTNASLTVIDSLGKYSTVNASSTDASGNFSWTPAKSDIGKHTLTLVGTDSYGNQATDSATVTVSASVAAAAAAAPTGSAQTSTNAAGTAAASSASDTAANAVAPAPAAASGKQDGYVFTAYLGIGSRGAAVTELQKHLTVDGSYAGPVTGYFGPLTAAGVKTFQGKNGIAQVGYVGPQTRKALNAE